MRSGRTALVFALLAAIPLRAEIVRVASYNVRNYTATDRMEDGGWTPDAPKPEAEKDALRAVIRTVHPDVIVFEEMGPPGYLEELRLDLASEGLVYPYSAHLEAADPDRHVAALSKIPFVKVGKYADLFYTVAGEKFLVKRGLLSLTFVTQGREWTLYGAHLKSRVGAQQDERKNTQERNGEAGAIRNRIGRDQPAGSLWMLAGDMNDSPGGGAWNRLTEKSEQRLGVDLRPVDSHGEVWTYNYARKDTYERIDMLLASEKLDALVVKGSAKICDAPQAAEASDHRMIYVDLDFPDAK